MIKSLKLNELAYVLSGFTFRRSFDESIKGTVVVQAKDILNLYINKNVLPCIDRNFSQAQLLKHGDVVMTARGRFRASVVNFHLAAVASSSCIVIRIKGVNLLPEFLALYLNSESAQAYFTQVSKGAGINAVTIYDLKHLSVPIPAVKEQQVLVSLYQNIDSQHKLLTKRLHAGDALFSSIFEQQIKGAMV